MLCSYPTKTRLPQINIVLLSVSIISSLVWPEEMRTPTIIFYLWCRVSYCGLGLSCFYGVGCATWARGGIKKCQMWREEIIPQKIISYRIPYGRKLISVYRTTKCRDRPAASDRSEIAANVQTLRHGEQTRAFSVRGVKNSSPGGWGRSPPPPKNIIPENRVSVAYGKDFS